MSFSPRAADGKVARRGVLNAIRSMALVVGTLALIAPAMADQGPIPVCENGTSGVGIDTMAVDVVPSGAPIRLSELRRFTNDAGVTVFGECDPFAPTKIGSGFGVVTISSTLDGVAPSATAAYATSTGAQTGRLNRDAVPSECGAVKPNPGLFTASGSRQYDQYQFVALSSGCLSVTLYDAGENVLFAAAYDENGFLPSDPSSNYLADIGASPSASFPRTMGFDVTAGQIFNIVIHEVNSGGGIGQSYAVDLAGVKLEPDFSVDTTLDTTAAPLSPAYLAATGAQTGRLNRFQPAATCADPKANPGLFTASGDRQADLYFFRPAGTGCALVSLSQTGAGQTQIVSYDENGFNPFDPSANYLADPGVSVNNGTVFYSFRVTNGVPFYVVASEVDPGTGIGDEYFLNISNVDLVPRITIRDYLDASIPPTQPEYSTGTGLQTGRLNRFSPVATCADPKANPGLFTATGLRQYDVYTFTPPENGCVEVKIRTDSPDYNLYAAAYDQNGFNPADPGANFLADHGNSPNNEFTRTFSFSATAGVPFSVVVHEVNPGGGVGQFYELKVGGTPFWMSGLPLFEDDFESGDTSAWN